MFNYVYKKILFIILMFFYMYSNDDIKNNLENILIYYSNQTEEIKKKLQIEQMIEDQTHIIKEENKKNIDDLIEKYISIKYDLKFELLIKEISEIDPIEQESILNNFLEKKEEKLNNLKIKNNNINVVLKENQENINKISKNLTEKNNILYVLKKNTDIENIINQHKFLIEIESPLKKKNPIEIHSFIEKEKEYIKNENLFQEKLKDITRTLNNIKEIL